MSTYFSIYSSSFEFASFAVAAAVAFAAIGALAIVESSLRSRADCKITCQNASGTRNEQKFKLQSHLSWSCAMAS